MIVAFVNKSTEVPNEQMQDIVDAVGIQLATHHAPLYERLPSKAVLCAHESDAPAGSILLMVFDDADQAGALGWHTEGPNGEFYGKVFVRDVLKNGGGILDPSTAGFSVSQTASHEALEAVEDAPVNDYCDGPPSAQGVSRAREIADPVEANGYWILLPNGHQVWVSAFVGPKWFDENAKDTAELTYPAGLVAGPFQLASGGYCVCRNAPGTEQEVFGAVPPAAWRLEGKKLAASRTARRKAKGQRVH